MCRWGDIFLRKRDLQEGGVGGEVIDNTNKHDDQGCKKTTALLLRACLYITFFYDHLFDAQVIVPQIP